MIIVSTAQLSSSFNPNILNFSKLNVFSGLNGVGKSTIIKDTMKHYDDYHVRFVSGGNSILQEDYEEFIQLVLKENENIKVCDSLLHPHNTSTDFLSQLHTWASEFGFIRNQINRTFIATNLVSNILRSKNGDIMIFDKPETHLHPKYQFILGQLFVRLIKNNVQVFLETHSDSIFNAIRIAVKNNVITKDDVGIFFLTRENDVTNIEKILLDKKGQCRINPRDFLGDNVSTELFQLI